jgi:hypothetical protein
MRRQGENMKFMIASILVAAAATTASAQILPYSSVVGKEYSARFDWNTPGAPSPGRVLAWAGGGPVADGVLLPSAEVDAIANVRDAYLPNVINDTASLVLSFHTAPSNTPGTDIPTPTGFASLWTSETAAFGATRSVWAYANQVDFKVPQAVDGIEVWGPDNDTTHWSDLFDVGGVAVRSGAGTPYFTSAELAFALGVSGIPLDLDGLMVNDFVGSEEIFDVGDVMLVSVAANGFFDGGEIWVITRTPNGAPTASFLNHGGVTWDTANPVGALFGHGFEEIDGLEAIIPAPGALALLGIGGLLVTRRRR